METIYYSVDMKQITCQAGEERQASGAPEGVRCVVVPRKRPADAKGGTVIDFEACRRAAERARLREEQACAVSEQIREQERKNAAKRERRAAFGFIADVCATAAIIAVAALVLIRFCML